MDPIQMLRQLATQSLPATFIRDADVDTVRMLVMAGHAKAVVPQPTLTLGGHMQPPVVVTEVTRLGHTILSMFPEGRMAQV